MIYVSTVSRRGTSHPDWNEDNFFIKETAHAIVGGVFDGCSSGRDSYFASKLFANIFKKTVDESSHDIAIHTFPAMIQQFCKNLNKAAKCITMSTDEMLSTAVFFVYEYERNELLVKFFGDGCVYSNGDELLTFNNDEDNRPDYLAYHLADILKSNNAFANYYNSKKSFSAITTDFSIASDGIFTFRKTIENEPDFDFTDFLVKETFLYKNPASLKRKLNILQNKGYEHYDDLTILRVIKE